MSLLISIFGGMLMTAVLYGVGRRYRLSNYWSAVIAAAIPTVAYLVYVIGHPVGLDTVTLHVIAYPTVAVLLGMLGGAKARQERHMHWAPKLLIGFFIVMVSMMAGFVYIAGQGLPPTLAQRLLPNADGKNIHTGFAGVVEHHQDAAKGIGHHLRMEDKLARLGWRVEIAGLSELRAGSPGPISVRILDKAGQSVGGVTVAMTLARPGQLEQASTKLAYGPHGYHATLPGLDAGIWVATLRLSKGQDKVALEHSLVVQ